MRIVIFAVLILLQSDAEKPGEFLVKIIIPTYTKTVKSYEKLVSLLCTKEVRKVNDFDDLPVKTKAEVQKTLKEMTSLAHKVCFDANKFMKKSREEENDEQHKTDEIRGKIRALDVKKVQMRTSKTLARDQVQQAKRKRTELEDKLQLKKEELDETKRKMEQSKCRKKRKGDDKKKEKSKGAAPDADEKGGPQMGGMKAIRCQFDKVLRKQKEKLEKEVEELDKELKQLKKDESNAGRELTDNKSKLEQERKEIDKVENDKESTKINASDSEAELRKSKKLIDNVRVLQGHLQNVHDGITKDVKVIDRDLPVIVLAMKKINIALMGFNIKNKKAMKLPSLQKLETFADQAEKDNTKKTAESKQ